MKARIILFLNYKSVKMQSAERGRPLATIFRKNYCFQWGLFHLRAHSWVMARECSMTDKKIWNKKKLCFCQWHSQRGSEVLSFAGSLTTVCRQSLLLPLGAILDGGCKTEPYRLVPWVQYATAAMKVPAHPLHFPMPQANQMSSNAGTSPEMRLFHQTSGERVSCPEMATWCTSSCASCHTRGRCSAPTQFPCLVAVPVQPQVAQKCVGWQQNHTPWPPCDSAAWDS